MRVVQMFVQKAAAAGLLRGIFVLPLLAGAPAHAMTLEEALQTAGNWADSAAAAIGAGITGVVDAVSTLNPTTLQIGLIGGSVLVAAAGLWLLLRRPRQSDEEREAAAILAQRLPDLRVRTQIPRPHIARGPRLLEAVAAMKAEMAMHAAESAFRRDRY